MVDYYTIEMMLSTKVALHIVETSPKMGRQPSQIYYQLSPINIFILPKCR